MDLSIIIPSYNTKELLRACLESIYRETKRVSFEVIVVDSASRDGSAVMVKKEFPKVKLLELGQNLGYGAANNAGVKRSQGEWLLLLNSDTQILEGAIDKLWQEAVPAGGQIKGTVFGCQLLNQDGSLQPSAGYFPNLGKVFSQMFFLDDLPLVKRFFHPYQQDQHHFYQKDQEVDWVTGAVLLLKKADFLTVGGFDEKIFMYAEEIDLCYRLKRLGRKVWYKSGAKVAHLKGGSSTDGFTAAVVGEYQGLVSFFRKHKPLWQLPILKILLASGALLRLGLFAIIDRRKKGAYEKAFKSLW